MTETSAIAPLSAEPRRHHLDRRASDLAAAGAAAGDPDDLLTTSEVAEWLGLSTPWLEIGRCKDYGPRYVRLSPRRVRYRRADVLAWLADRTHANTAEYRAAPKAGRKPGSHVIDGRVIPPEPEEASATEIPAPRPRMRRRDRRVLRAAE